MCVLSSAAAVAAPLRADSAAVQASGTALRDRDSLAAWVSSGVKDLFEMRSIPLPASGHVRDSIAAEERTQRFYDSLRAKSDRSRFWHFVHDLVIVPTATDAEARNDVVDEAEIYGRYAGRRIAAVEFVRDNIFDGADKGIRRVANAVHAVTGERTVRRDLLLRAGDVLDPDVVVRSKQLLRSRPYIADVSVEILPDTLDPDAVVVRIATRDSWTISGDGSVRGLSGRVRGELFDVNFLGTGNRLGYQLSLDWRKRRYEGSMLRYDVPNLFGTFYEADLRLGRSFDETYYGASVGKRFISPTDYGLGALFERVSRAVRVRYAEQDGEVAADYMMSYNHLDLWGGGSWQQKPDVGSIFLSGRVDWLDYFRPLSFIPGSGTPAGDGSAPLPVEGSLNPYFRDRTTLLGSLGLYRERFLTANLIYGYGYDEYIATGYRAGITLGYMHRADRDGLYGGVEACSGGFTPLGYLRGSVEAGGFLDPARRGFFGVALDARVDYFTRLLGRRRFKVRQFLSVDYLGGWNRESGFREQIWFTGESGPRYLAYSPVGSTRLVFSGETVVFTPWKPLGFRIALYCLGDVGLLGFDRNVFRNGVYATVGAGIRLKNEKLVFGTIQLSFFVSFSKSGIIRGDWMQLSSESRIQAGRYNPHEPRTVEYR